MLVPAMVAPCPPDFQVPYMESEVGAYAVQMEHAWAVVRSDTAPMGGDRSEEGGGPTQGQDPAVVGHRQHLVRHRLDGHRRDDDHRALGDVRTRHDLSGLNQRNRAQWPRGLESASRSENRNGEVSMGNFSPVRCRKRMRVPAVSWSIPRRCRLCWWRSPTVWSSRSRSTRTDQDWPTWPVSSVHCFSRPVRLATRKKADDAVTIQVLSFSHMIESSD